MTIKQRKTKNLGINRSRGKERVYEYIENVLKIKTKKCARATSNKPSKYGIIHEGPTELPIRFFNLQYSFYDDQNDRVVVEKGDGLQVYCIECERKYRRGRLNKRGNFYGKMTDKEVYSYYKKIYGNTCHCSRCGLDKAPEDFTISRNMDKGLHNVCKECSKKYSEAVGDRRIIYSPDGNGSKNMSKKGKCAYCNNKDGIHIDHIRPVSKGGSDNLKNLQHLCSTCNISKSDSLDKNIKTVYHIDNEIISTRYLSVLKQAKKENRDMNKFLLKISHSVREFIQYKNSLSDEKLYLFFAKEKARSNRKYDVKRCVRKFREYINNRKAVG